MSELPHGWEQAAVVDLLAPLSDGRLVHQGWSPRCETEPSRDFEHWAVLKTTAIQDGRFHDEHNKRLPDKLVPRPLLEIREGDLLLTCAGPRARCGVPALVRKTRPRLMMSGKMYRMRPAPQVEPGYLEAALRTTTAQKAIDELKTGMSESGMNLTHERFATLEVPVAPAAEQRRIAAKLDALTARTAHARADLDRIPALAVRYRQAVLAKAFSGELTASWRKNRPSSESGEALRAAILRERQQTRLAKGLRGSGANRSVPARDRELPDLPNGWAWMTFDECSWDLTVGHVGPMKDRYEPDGVPFLRSMNIKTNAISARNLVYVASDFHDELKKSQLSAGTIVVIRTGEPGVAAVIPQELDGSNCSDLVICRPVEGLNPHFGARYINSEFAKAVVRATQVGVAQQHFNVGAMSQLPVPVAPPEEQVEIVRRIDHAFAEIDRLTTEAAAARRLLGRLDQAVLAKAFRGELVPQDPADEPAAVLLDRIRAERAAAPKAKRGRRAAA